MKFALKLPKLPSRSAQAAPVEADPENPTFLARLLDRKRLMRVAALFIVAGSAGQVMQIMQARNAAQVRVANIETPSKPESIVALSGEATPDLAAVTPGVQVATVAPAPEVQPEQAQTSPVVVAAAATILPANPGPKTLTPPQTTPVLAAATPQAEMPMPAPADPVAAACPVTLDLAEVPGAMIGITLIAPCAPNARVVLQHEGLAVTGLTTASGALFASLPAFSPDAKVEATLTDGTKVAAQIAIPAATDFRRFGVQWHGDDAFQVNAYQAGAAFGGPGHINGVQPGLASDAGGFLQILGDSTAPMPLLAEIYTYPLSEAPVNMVVESAVTDLTCGRELLADILSAQGGHVVVTDLTLSMPDCSAVGDFLVLNNLAQDMTLAAN